MFSANEFIEKRNKMVENQIHNRGIEDAATLHAMRSVPRHVYVTADQQHMAYDDFPLPIACRQTISQPYIVAFMTSLLSLQSHETVLEIGTGSGYQSAILSRIAARVYSMERIPPLCLQAKRVNDHLGYDNITYLIGDGSLGWPGPLHFDAILVAAGAPAVPQVLLHQLNDHGRMIIPVGDYRHQTLQLWQRTGDAFDAQESIPVVFVPLKGKQAW